MMSHLVQRNRLCPCLKSITIDAKTIVSSQSNEIGRFPRAVTCLGSLGNGTGFLLQTFRLQGTHPRTDCQSAQFRNNLITRRIIIRAQQFPIMFLHTGRHLKLKLGNQPAVGCSDFPVHFRTDMQHDIVITTIILMTMKIPVGRPLVNLDITHPQRPSYLHLSIEEVGASIMVMQSYINDFQFLPVGSVELSQRKELMLPAKMQQYFHSFQIYRFDSAKVRKERKTKNYKLIIITL